MTLNAYFDFALVYGVGSMLDVVNGVKFSLEMSEAGVTVFHDNDKVLSVEHNDSWINITALELGKSTIRIMNGPEILKDLVIEVRSSITKPATTLGGSLGEPQPK
jgi:hypothetical protein